MKGRLRKSIKLPLFAKKNVSRVETINKKTIRDLTGILICDLLERVRGGGGTQKSMCLPPVVCVCGKLGLGVYEQLYGRRG